MERELFNIDGMSIVALIWAVFAIVALRKVEYLFGVYCSFFFLLFSIKVGSFNLLQLTFIFASIGVCSIVLKSRASISLLKHKPNILMVSFFLWLLFSLYFITTDVSYGAKRFKYFCYFSLWPYFALQVVANRRQLVKRFISAFIVTCLVMAILTYFVFDPRTMLSGHDASRLSLFSDPITFSTPFAISCVLLVYLYGQTRGYFYKILLCCLFSLFCLIIFLSGTRQTLFGMILCAILVIFLNSGKRATSYILIFVGCIGLAYQFIDLTGVFGLETRLFDALSDPIRAIQSRLDYYDEAFRAFLNSPLIGNGLGSFGWYIRPEEKEQTHNLVLDILAETGLIGFVLFSTFLYEVFRHGLQLIEIGSKSIRPLIIALLGVLIFSLIQSQISGGIESTGSVLWSAAIILAMRRIMVSSGTDALES